MLQSGAFLHLKCQNACRLFATKASSYDKTSPLPYNHIPKPGPLQHLSKMTVMAQGKFDLMHHAYQRHKELGPIYKENIFPGVTKMTVITCDPGDTETLLRLDSRLPLRPTLDPLGKIRTELNFHKGISESNGEEWYKIRSVVNQHFLTNPSIWSYGEEHFNVAKDFVDFIGKNLDENNEVPNFEYALKCWALEAAGVFSLDTRLGLFSEVAPHSKELIEAQELFFQSLHAVFHSFPTWRWFETASYKELKESQFRVIKAILKHIKAMQSNSSPEQKTQLKSFLDRSELTDNEKEMVISDFLSGGIETTAYSSVFPLYAIAKNPNKQEILRDEITKYIGDSPVVSGKTIAQMPYLNAVVKEAQRLYPFSAFYARDFEKEIVLSNYRIPPGVSVLNSSNIMNNRDPRYFDNPDEFIPERWFDSKQRKKASFATVGSFGVGARKCPGRKFALQEIHCLIAAILSRYRLEYHHKPLSTKLRLLIVPNEEPKFTFLPL